MERSIIALRNMLAMMTAMAYAKCICNTLEGLWAALRTFLQPFRGVHKRYKDDFGTLLRAMVLDPP